MTGATRPILRIRSPIIGRGEQVFELVGTPVTIGRADDCDIVLLEQSASRLHARLLPDGDGWLLVDEGSHAGVFIGPQRVTRQHLSDGDRFRIGETDFQLVERPASQPTLIGATRPPGLERPAVPSIGTAPTLASIAMPASEVPRPHVELPRPPQPPPPPPPVVAVPVVAPADPPGARIVAVVLPPEPPLPPPAGVAAPRPHPSLQAPAASAPSFVDFGPVGRPEQAPSESQSFSGQLVDDPSRVALAEERMSSRWGTWILVVLLFVGLSLLVLALAYDVTFSDLMSVFD